MLLVYQVYSFTAAKADSIGFIVFIYDQCADRKSWDANNSSRSFSSFFISTEYTSLITFFLKKTSKTLLTASSQLSSIQSFSKLTLNFRLHSLCEIKLEYQLFYSHNRIHDKCPEISLPLHLKTKSINSR